MSKQIKPLNKSAIDNFKPSAEPYRKFDGEGLLIEIRPTGRKFWRFEYISPTTKKRGAISIGEYPQISLLEARNARFAFRSLLARGIDPNERRKAEKQKAQDRQAQTIAIIAARWLEMKREKNKEKTTIQAENRLKRYIFPPFEQVPISEISAPMVAEALQPIYDDGKKETFFRVLRLFNELMGFAMNCGLIQFNPLANLHKNFKQEEARKMPSIAPAELPRLLHDVAKSRAMHLTKLMIHFQLLCLTRSAETARAEWCEIDWQAQTWTIPAHKRKLRKGLQQDFVVPLPTQALAVLQELQQLTGKSAYIFASPMKLAHCVSMETVNNALKRMGYKNRLVAHGFRSIGSTYLHESGKYSPELVEACLSHVIGSKVQRSYDRGERLTLRRAIMQDWGDYVEQCGKEAKFF